MSSSSANFFDFKIAKSACLKNSRLQYNRIPFFIKNEDFATSCHFIYLCYDSPALPKVLNSYAELPLTDDQDEDLAEIQKHMSSQQLCMTQTDKVANNHEEGLFGIVAHIHKIYKFVIHTNNTDEVCVYTQKHTCIFAEATCIVWRI